MKNIAKYLLVSVVAALCLAACSKDNGNYTYKDVAEFKIDTVGMGDDRFVIYSLTTATTVINYKPTVFYDKPLDKLEYAWVIHAHPYTGVKTGNTTVYPPADTICRTHSLNWTVDVKVGQYVIAMIATDPENGRTATYQFYTRVDDAGRKSGLYVLSEYDGKTDIDVYGSALALIIGGDHFTPKFYSSLHGGEMMEGKPRFISYGALSTKLNDNCYYVFTETDGVSLDPAGLKQIDRFDQMFYVPTTYNPQALKYTNNCNFLINDGKLHLFYANKTNDRKFSAPVSGNYNASTYLQAQTKNSTSTHINADQIIFDKIANGFRPYYPLGASLSQFKPTLPTAEIDANNMPGTVVKSLESNGGYTLNVMNISDAYWLYVLKFYARADEGDLSFGGPASKISLAGCKDIDKARFWASSNSGGAFFYATDKAVYSFSYTSGQTAQKDIWQCGAGEEITYLLQLGGGGFPTAGCVLWIAVWNESTKTGKLVEFEIDPTGGGVRWQWGAEPWVGASTHSNPHITEGFGKIKSMTILGI